MARRTTKQPPPPDDFEEHIVDIDVERRDAGRASSSTPTRSSTPAPCPTPATASSRCSAGSSTRWPSMGLRPDRGHVKSARVVGEVMGKLHPHGDGAIYDALVRMAQPFVDAAAARRRPRQLRLASTTARPPSRYTEARLAPAALLMTGGHRRGHRRLRPQLRRPAEPSPACCRRRIPNLLVNGATGIAVGMATNMAPHNLVEVIAAPRHLIAHPDGSPRRPDAVRPRPRPARPAARSSASTASATPTRPAAARSGPGRPPGSRSVTPRRKGIVVTELPYVVGPEKVIEQIKDLVQAKKLQGIADVKDLTDREHGLRLVIEVKNGFNPEAVLEQLYRLTPMEDSFGINNVALVDGQPRTLGLQGAAARSTSTTASRSCAAARAFRLRKRQDRLHLVEGLLVAILDIDEVIQLIRSSDDAGAGQGRG